MAADGEEQLEQLLSIGCHFGMKLLLIISVEQH